jgi:hypothetical protein
LHVRKEFDDLNNIITAKVPISRMLERLQEKFNGSEPHTPDEMHWQIDQAVVALFHLENKWHRAKILKELACNDSCLL